MVRDRSQSLRETLSSISERVDKELSKSAAVIIEDDALLSGAARMPYFPLAVERAKGSLVWDADGNEYIDLLASAATASLGHSPDEVLAVVFEQMKKVLCYNVGYVYHKPVAELSRKLVEITPGTFPKRISYGLSGSDAVDGAYHLARACTGRQQFISFRGAYHGVTMGAHNLSAIDSNMKRNSTPKIAGITHVPYPDPYRGTLGAYGQDTKNASLDWLENIFRTEVSPADVAGIIVEPLQGDAGIIVPPSGFLTALANICKREGILLIAEEVQTGFGRTGKLFAVNHEDVEPDILILGKGMGGGMPISAIVARAELMEHDGWRPPAHTFTHGGNPPACVAALAVIKQIYAKNLSLRSRELGQALIRKLQGLKDEFDIIGDVRGRGLMVGVEIVTDQESKERGEEITKQICFRCWEKGLILTFLNGNVLRFTPALTIPEEQLWRAVDILRESIRDALDQKVGRQGVAFALGR